MNDEFDDILRAQAPPERSVPSAVTRGARLVARLYAAAGTPLRARLLRCLMQPLGTLGAAGVAAGAFVTFLGRQGGVDPDFDPHALDRVSSDQVRELASFVEQVEPLALQQFAGLVADSPLAMASFSASALALLYRQLQPGSASRRWRRALRPPAATTSR